MKSLPRLNTSIQCLINHLHRKRVRIIHLRWVLKQIDFRKEGRLRRIPTKIFWKEIRTDMIQRKLLKSQDRKLLRGKRRKKSKSDFQYYLSNNKRRWKDLIKIQKTLKIQLRRTIQVLIMYFHPLTKLSMKV